MKSEKEIRKKIADIEKLRDNNQLGMVIAQHILNALYWVLDETRFLDELLKKKTKTNPTFTDEDRKKTKDILQKRKY